VVKKKHASNGHLPQLKTEQQLQLSRIQKRIFQYKAAAGEIEEQKQKMIEAAKAADLEFGQLLNKFATSLNCDSTTTEFDLEKLQFKRKEAAAAPPQEPAAPAAN